MIRQVVIIAPGSRGDVQPCVALGRGLAADGDRVRVLAAPGFRALVEMHGLGFAPLSADPGALLGSAAGQAWTTGRRRLAFLSGLRAVLRPVLDGLLADVHAGAEGADLVLAPSLGFLGAHLGAHLGVPDAELHYQPSVPTRAFAHPLLPQATRLGPWGRRLSFGAVDTLAWQVLRPEIDRWRVETLGLPRAGPRGPRRRSPVLCGFSGAVVPRPADWPARVHVTGYWFLDPGPWRPDPRLRDFLAAGPPPVYVGFGSMRPAEADAVFTVVRAALRRAGLRGLLAAGGGPDTDDLLTVADVPHAWLFPRTAAVVHHGGAGTTAAALRAGVPSLVCPVFSDQPYWGERVFRLSAGPKPLPLEELDVDVLTARLRELTGNPLFRRGAQYVGARLRAEDGVARACSVLRSE